MTYAAVYVKFTYENIKSGAINQEEIGARRKTADRPAKFTE